MAKFTKYFFLFAFVFILQMACFPVLFAYGSIPPTILLSTTALSLVIGFHKSLPIIVTVGVIHDIIFNLTPGLSTIIFVLVSYFVSFFSKKFLIENKTGGLLLVASIAVLAIILNHFYLFFLNKISNTNNGQSIFSSFLFDGLMLEIIIGIAIFFVLIFVFQKIEKKSLIMSTG